MDGPAFLLVSFVRAFDNFRMAHERFCRQSTNPVVLFAPCLQSLACLCPGPRLVSLRPRRALLHSPLLTVAPSRRRAIEYPSFHSRSSVLQPGYMCTV